MKLKKSFCKGMIIRKDITRFWPLWSVLFIVLQLMYTLPVLFSGISCREEYKGEHRWECLAENGVREMCNAASPFLIAVIGILTAVLVFGYLTKKKESYMFHCFPVTRREYFCSHFLAGYLMIVVPYVITYIAIGGISAILGVNLLSVMVANLLEVVIMITLFYTLACLVVMLSGNAAISVIIFCVLNSLAVGIFFLAGGVTGLFLNVNVITYIATSGFADILKGIIIIATPVYTFHDFIERPLLAGKGDSFFWNDSLKIILGDNLYNVSGNMDELTRAELRDVTELTWQNARVMLWYLIPAVLFLILAYYLNQKRPLERVGDTLAFPWGKPVFHWVFTFCGSFLFVIIAFFIGISPLKDYLGTYRNLFWVGMLCLLAGSVICYIISNMILQRSFRIWKNFSFVQMIICSVCVLGMMFIMRYQCYHKYFPKAEEIQRISIEVNNPNYSDACTGTMVVEDQKDIRKILEIQKDLFREAENMKLREEGEDNIQFSFMNELGDDRLETGIYCMGENSYKKHYKKLFSVINRKDTMFDKVFSKNYPKMTENEYSFSLFYGEEQQVGGAAHINLHKQEVVQALQADMKAGNITLGKNVLDDETYLMLEVSILPGKLSSKSKTDRELAQGDSEQEYGATEIPITSSCENLGNLFKKLGIEMKKSQ